MKVFKKYIRTKEGIYQQRKPLLDEYIVGNETFVYSHPSIKDRDIIQDADTIEELCDEFVGVYHNICEVLIKKDNWEKYDIFYGAMWTDKGLIYVAKMNDKGELELL